MTSPSVRIDVSGAGIRTLETAINETIVEAPRLVCFIDGFTDPAAFKPCSIKAR